MGGQVSSEQLKKACLGCISENLRCKMLILGRDISWGGVGVERYDVTLT